MYECNFELYKYFNGGWEGNSTGIKETEKDIGTKKLFTAENDEEVLNCEGKPCNFVYDDKNK